ncbi:hypothetical protein ACHAWO_003532 [Cyclotella atomus]|uniref:Uncharacterized protein n=1 Tax=Cyclotella atomus TaxID=382360 RepID=A0ABD3MRY1_9STRA
MKIPTVFLFATAAVALANNLRGNEPVDAVSNDIELTAAEKLDPDSRESRELGTTHSYHKRAGTGWGGSFTTRTKATSSGRKRTTAKSSRRRSSGHKKTGTGWGGSYTARTKARSSSGRKKTGTGWGGSYTALTKARSSSGRKNKWGGGHGTRYYKKKVTRARRNPYSSTLGADGAPAATGTLPGATVGFAGKEVCK